MLRKVQYAFLINLLLIWVPIVAFTQGIDPPNLSISWGYQLTAGAILVISLSLCGAVGGYLAAAQSGLTDIPLFKYITGAAGAIVIVTIAPMQNVLRDLIQKGEIYDIISLVGLALTGGYAGSTLLEAAAARFKTQLDRVEEKTNRIDTIEQALQKSANATDIATELAHRILNGQQLNVVEMQQFQQALIESTPSTRGSVAYLADENRRQNWQIQPENLERSKLIFQALIQTPEAKSHYWWYASLGFCLKDQVNPDYLEAKNNLDRAIGIRNDLGHGVSGAYEFNRAYVNIKMDQIPSLQEQINKDLDVASKFRRWKEIIDSNRTIQEWKAKHAISSETASQSNASSLFTQTLNVGRAKNRRQKAAPPSPEFPEAKRATMDPQ
jgi:hypothetical protein